MIFPLLAFVLALAALAVLGAAAVVWIGDGDTFALAVRATTTFTLLSLSSWTGGDRVGVLGMLVAAVLAGVLAISWAVRREGTYVVPDDLSSLERTPRRGQ